MALYGLLWHFIAFYGYNGLLWQNFDLIGLVSSFLAVIDPNSFGLVSFKIGCIFRVRPIENQKVSLTYTLESMPGGSINERSKNTSVH